MSKNSHFGLEVVHFTKNATVMSYYKLGDILIPVNDHLTTEDKLNYDFKTSDKSEALYKTLVWQLQNNKSTIMNYKRSKHFEQYKERLIEEYPELLI